MFGFYAFGFCIPKYLGIDPVDRGILPQKHRYMIITIASFKGGVGKTTTAIHIAAYLASRRGARAVALADGDRNRTAVSWADRADFELPFKVYGDDVVPEDWDGDLVIDTPGNIEEAELLSLASGSDLVVIPTLCAAFSLENTIETLRRLKGLSKYRILLTAVPPKPSKAGERAIEAIDSVKLPRFKQSISRRAVYVESELEGIPTSMLKGAAAKLAWSDYQSVGKELLRYTK
jgi:chromosome partitioning protein